MHLLRDLHHALNVSTAQNLSPARFPRGAGLSYCKISSNMAPSFNQKNYMRTGAHSQ